MSCLVPFLVASQTCSGVKSSIKRQSFSPNLMSTITSLRKSLSFSYIFWHRMTLLPHQLAHQRSICPSYPLILIIMSNIASSSKLSPQYLYPPSTIPSTSSSSEAQLSSLNTSRWSSASSLLQKPKPALLSKRSLRRLGYHPPYSIGDHAYLRSCPDSPLQPYTFQGTHISDHSTPEKTYYIAVFESSRNHIHTVYAFDVMDNPQRYQSRRKPPKFFIWIRTLFCSCF